MSRDEEVTREEADALIESVAQKIHENQMDSSAILFLEGSKPLVHIGGMFSTVFVDPFLPIFSEATGNKIDRAIRVFEHRANVEKLIQRIEQLSGNERERKRQEKEAKNAARAAAKAAEKEAKKAAKKG